MADAYDIWLATDPWWEGKCGECAQDEDECECEEEEALQLLNDLRITLIIEDAEAKHGERNDT